MKILYFFNPENDMALASGSPYYMAPASAKKMAKDLCTLPVWYAEKGSNVLFAKHSQIKWMHDECPFSFDLNFLLDIPSDCSRVLPWGWSPVVIRCLGLFGVKKEVLPTMERMNNIRSLSSRRIAVDLLPLLRFPGTLGQSEWLTSMESVSKFLKQQKSVLLKAPWSGSGKGIQRLDEIPDKAMYGWINRIISTQGGIVGEPYYNKVVDFAMEFNVREDDCSFAGYSIFDTDRRGIYKGNELCSDEMMEDCLSSYVSLDLLYRVRDRLMEELSSILRFKYTGFLGIDMMVCCTSDGEYVLHPCVEINLRMNMGIVSRIFYDRYVYPEAKGKYIVEYFQEQGEALKNHEFMKEKYPLVLEKGRIRKGYLSLTPVFESTNYQIFILIH